MVWGFPFSFMPRRVNVAVSDFQSFFLPLLKFAKDGQAQTTKRGLCRHGESFQPEQRRYARDAAQWKTDDLQKQGGLGKGLSFEGTSS